MATVGIGLVVLGLCTLSMIKQFEQDRGFIAIFVPKSILTLLECILEASTIK